MKRNLKVRDNGHRPNLTMQTFGVEIKDGFVRGDSTPEDEGPGGQPSGVVRFFLHSLIGVTFFSGLTLVAYGGVLAVEGTDWWLVVILALAAIAAERTDMSLYGDSRISLAIVPIFGTVIGAGMPGLAVVVPVAILASAKGRPLRKTAFNFGALMLSAAAAAVLIRAPVSHDFEIDWPEVLLPATVAALINFLVNSILVAAAIGLSTRSAIPRVWAERYPWLLPHYLMLAILGLVMVTAYQLMGIWGIAVFLAPPLMMRLSIRQYLDKTSKSVLDLRHANSRLKQANEQATEAMASLGRAYDDTLRSLSAALDARDSETAGHSARVADLTMAIAEEVGIERDTDEWRNISWGALLHDVGKIAVPDQILRKPGSLTDEEWRTMRQHPHTGHQILQKVGFLRTASDVVLAHHERFDGSGYPRGLTGEEIPLGARIFSIADAFDAMTSDRTYRGAMPAEEALAELLRNSGTQFDPTVVRAFLSVYQKRFVGTVHHRHLGVSRRSEPAELSESLKQAITEAAGLDEDL
jgi:putative nucleotidyltransferase with HDIG domain